MISAVRHPIRAAVPYYTTSPDGGLTWQAPQRLASGLHGRWAPSAVGGTATCAVALLSRAGVLHVSTRPVGKASAGHKGP